MSGVGFKFRDPLEAIVEIKKQLDAMFKDILSSFPKMGEYLEVHEPLCDLEEAEDAYILRVDVPGFSRDEIRVKATEDFVEIEATKSEEKIAEEASRNYVFKQRLYHRIHKVVELPEKIDPSGVKAKLINGVLEVYMPKAGVKKEVEIPVEVE